MYPLAVGAKRTESGKIIQANTLLLGQAEQVRLTSVALLTEKAVSPLVVGTFFWLMVTAIIILMGEPINLWDDIVSEQTIVVFTLQAVLDVLTKTFSFLNIFMKEWAIITFFAIAK